MLTKLSAAFAAICMLSAAALAQESAKPTDPQIAHIAYTAGEIDIKAAKQALAKSRNKEVRAFALPKRRLGASGCAITKPRRITGTG